MFQKPKVLFVVTSHDKLGNTDRKTGWYLPEGAHPHEILAPHTDITWASPNGGFAPLDPMSKVVAEADTMTQAFLRRTDTQWKTMEKLSSFLGRANEFDAIFYVGGWGPMFDLSTDETSQKLIREFYGAEKIISSVCHGPAALALVKLDSGKYFLEGEPVTWYSNVEQEMAKVRDFMPFSLEDALTKASDGEYTKAAQPLDPHVVIGRGGKLINGQNPASAGPVGQAILDSIRGSNSKLGQISTIPR